MPNAVVCALTGNLPAHGQFNSLIFLRASIIISQAHPTIFKFQLVRSTHWLRSTLFMTPQRSESPMETPMDTPMETCASAPFDHAKADVILRSADGVEFRVFMLFLSLASPFFETLFGLPQAPDGAADQEMK